MKIEIDTQKLVDFLNRCGHKPEGVRRLDADFDIVDWLEGEYNFRNIIVAEMYRPVSLPFTVILLRPQHMTDGNPYDTYTAHVRASDPNTAIRKAQHEAWMEDYGAEASGEDDDFKQYKPIAVYEGHIHMEVWDEDESI